GGALGGGTGLFQALGDRRQGRVLLLQGPVRLRHGVPDLPLPFGRLSDADQTFEQTEAAGRVLSLLVAGRRVPQALGLFGGAGRAVGGDLVLPRRLAEEAPGRLRERLGAFPRAAPPSPARPSPAP